MNRKSQRAEIALHRARVSDSFQELLAGTEDLLRSTASYTGSEIEAARERRQLAEARESAGEWETAARQRARRASVYADEVVHEHAWKSAGVAALVGCCWDAAWPRAAGAERSRRDVRRRAPAAESPGGRGAGRDAGRRRVQAGAACGSSLRASAVVRSCVGWNEFACAMAQPVWKTWWRNSPRSNSLGVSSGNSADSSRISLEEMRRAM